MARKEREPLSAVDTAWLRMEKPTSMAMITGVWLFDEPLDYERWKATIAGRFIPYKRFRSRIRNRLVGPAYWELDPCFCLDAHVHRIALPAPGDQAALQQLTGDLMSTPLDFNKPLWQMHFVENYGQGTAIITRLHHCLADGMALMQVVLSMTDDRSDVPWPEPFVEEESKSAWQPFRSLRPVVKTVQRTVNLTGTLAHESMETVRHPSRLMNAYLMGTAGTLALSKLLLLNPDQKTIFKQKCGILKRTAWSESIPLDHVKVIGKALGATVNDVLLAAYTGALRRYLEEHKQPVKDLNLRAFIPVNLRPAEDYHISDLGNRFGLVYLSLPVGLRDPVQRLQVVCERMQDIKESPEAIVAFGILNVTGMTSKQIEDLILKIFSSKGTMVITNVPGPRQVRYFVGRPIRGAMFWVPSPAELGMGVSIFSYANEVIVGVNTDASMVPDPERLVQFFMEEFDAMLALAKPPIEVVSEPEPEPVIAESQPVLPMIVPVEIQETIDIKPASGNGSKSDGHCQALTKSGQPCKNMALPGMSTCRVHQKQTVKL